ncbi:hypothetical protein ARMSODRAFT_963856 [Armillaria solidipes]|uniref:Uncharacterized protein n=1 Tax=Armillaria solidipes TaxID=1076256 RepID=A0A2H3BDU3_9AGAR|nr:hypothetical protein ARMSODRAFT_963856 [Armillaria solidipes]
MSKSEAASRTVLEDVDVPITDARLLFSAGPADNINCISPYIPPPNADPGNTSCTRFG